MDIRSILLDHGLATAEVSFQTIDLGKVTQDLINLSNYIDTSFADGIITETEAKRIQTFLSVLNSDSAKIQQEYDQVYNNGSLTDQTIKSNLLSAKTVYNANYQKLVKDINDAIADGVATTDETVLVDNDYNALSDSISVLSAAIENARDSILSKRSSDTLEAAKDYSDALKEDVDGTTDQLKKDLYDADGYIHTAFKDGIISDSENTSIQMYLNTLSTDKKAMDNKYTEVDNNFFLSDSVAKTNLQYSYQDYCVKYQSLVDAINNSIADNVITTDENNVVETAFIAFEDAVAVLSTYMERAIDSISKARADNAEALAKQYSDDNMAAILDTVPNDNQVTKKERITIKDDVSRIIGYIIGDTDLMPTIATLDTSEKGEAYNIRQEALNAGMPGTAQEYKDIGDAYTALAAYLNGMTPLPWDVTSDAIIEVDKTQWRTNWLNYFLSISVVQATITKTISEATDSKITEIQVGARNFLKNTGNMRNTTYWSLNQGSDIQGLLTVFQDPIYKNVIQASLTVNVSNEKWVIQNNGITLPNGKFTVGQDYTFSCLIQNQIPLTINFSDADGTNLVYPTSQPITVNAEWTMLIWTFTARATGNQPVLYISKSDDLLTGNVNLTYCKLETSNKKTDWSLAPEDLMDGIADLNGRISIVEQSVTGDSIVSTVMSSVSLQNMLDGKADATDLADYVTAEALAQEIIDRNAAIQSGISGLDFTTYVTQNTLTETATSLRDQFTSSGGVNMLKNSVGFSGTDFWIATGTVSTTQAAELEPYGALSGFTLNGGTLSQDITVTPGIPYTVSAYVKKGAAGTGYIQVSESGLDQPPIYQLLAGTEYDYQQIILTITPATSTITVKLNGDASSGGVIITALIANIGSTAFTWQQNPKEIYNTNINFDINGIRVSQTDENGNPTALTVMAPNLFAGYSDINGDHVIDQTIGGPDEIFRMDKDTFVMKSATIGPIKIINISGNGHSGIAFVGSN